MSAEHRLPAQRTGAVSLQRRSSPQGQGYIYPGGSREVVGLSLSLFLSLSLSLSPSLPPSLPLSLPPSLSLTLSPCLFPWRCWGRGGGWAEQRTAAPSPPAIGSVERSHLAEREDDDGHEHKLRGMPDMMEHSLVPWTSSPASLTLKA